MLQNEIFKLLFEPESEKGYQQVSNIVENQLEELQTRIEENFQSLLYEFSAQLEIVTLTEERTW